MATREDIYTAIRNADKAGDADAVRRLGEYLKTMPADDAAPAAPASQHAVPDGAQAASSGFYKSLVRMAGLPVDTVSNVVDLGRAAIGAPYQAITGKEPPQWLQPEPRENVVGSSDYLLKKLRGTSAAPWVTAQNPEYENGLLQAAGGGMSAPFNPKTRLELANQIGLRLSGPVLGQEVYNTTGDPALAAAAGLAPHGAQQAVTSGFKLAVRGGEAGRQAMEQRMLDLRNAGVTNPTLGLASGNPLIGGLENLIGQTPGGVGVMKRARDEAVAGMQAKTLGAAANASENRGTTEAGASAQAGAKTFRENFKATQGKLYDRLDQHIPGQAPVNVDNTIGALASLNADIPTMPNLSPLFKNGRIVGIEDALHKDMAGDTTGSPVKLSSIVDASGQPIILAPKGAPTPPRDAIPFEAVKKTRTLVGNELADHSLMSDVPRSKWNPLYGALSEDMGAAATQAGPQAENAFNRATDYTRAGIGRMERIAPTIDKPSPEGTFHAMDRSLAENTSTFQAVKKSLPQGARGDFAGTVIERLGVAKPGQQNADGSAWSPETFLTNWNRMAPKARAEMLSGFPNASQVAADVDAVAKATSMMRDNSKMWANPSGTASAATARTVLGGIGVGGAGAAMGLVNPLVPAAAAGTVGTTNLIARGLTSKRVVDAAARQNNPSQRLTAADLAVLSNLGLLGGTPTGSQR